MVALMISSFYHIPPKLNVLKNNEHLEQCLLVQWFRLEYAQYSKCLWAIPNGGARHITTAMRLKREGALAGVSDLFLMIPNKDKHGLFIEMKSAKGAKIQQNQLDFISLAKSMNYDAEVCFGFEEAREKIKNYLKDIK